MSKKTNKSKQQFSKSGNGQDKGGLVGIEFNQRKLSEEKFDGEIYIEIHPAQAPRLVNFYLKCYKNFKLFEGKDVFIKKEEEKFKPLLLDEINALSEPIILQNEIKFFVRRFFLIEMDSYDYYNGWFSRDSCFPEEVACLLTGLNPEQFISSDRKITHPQANNLFSIIKTWVTDNNTPTSLLFYLNRYLEKNLTQGSIDAIYWLLDFAKNSQKVDEKTRKDFPNIFGNADVQTASKRSRNKAATAERTKIFQQMADEIFKKNRNIPKKEVARMIHDKLKLNKINIPGANLDIEASTIEKDIRKPKCYS